jgi:chromate transporter
LGYFRAEFVERRHWLDDRTYSDVVALCQFLPGPTSSQVGMALGLKRAGWAGALAAWVGFTMPSAVALILFAYGVTTWSGLATSGALHGLKVVAVAVVAQAVWGMARSLCPDRWRAGLALGTAGWVLALPGPLGQVGAMALGACIGRWALKLEPVPSLSPQVDADRQRIGMACGVLYALLLMLLPAIAAVSSSLWLHAVAVVYQSGALVFGGGHVVLPLLQAGVVPPGWVSNDAFLAGYGAAQAVPGPLFTFAAFLGAVMPPPLGGWVGGLALLVVIFVPAFLLLMGVLPFWEWMRSYEPMRRALAGVNAAVVGVLGAALIHPIGSSALQAPADLGLAVIAFGLLMWARLSPLWVVAMAAAAGWALSAA